MAPRDPQFERDKSASELEIKVEMDRRFADYFAKKHGTPWQWCATCRAWDFVHEHEALTRRIHEGAFR